MMVIAWLAATVPAQPASTAEPSPDPAKQQKIRQEFGLVYQTDAEDSAGKADLLLPAEPAPASGYPIVVVIHGGAWTTGDKWTMGQYADRIARRGIATLAINYRLAPTFQYPAQVDDVRSALVWVNQHAEEYALDLDRVGVCGYSAGGHLALMVATLADESAADQQLASLWSADDPRWQQLPKIQAVCGGGPPCDFRPMPPENRMLAYFLGGSRAELPEIYRSASPAAHASANDPPTRLIHGQGDTLVPILSSQLMKRALVGAGVKCELIVVPKLGHAMTFLASETPRAIAEFFSDTLLADDAEGDSGR